MNFPKLEKEGLIHSFKLLANWCVEIFTEPVQAKNVAGMTNLTLGSGQALKDAYIFERLTHEEI